MNNVHSDTKGLVCGVPQGSVLGPKLFLLYINDLFHVIDQGKLILFADDTNLLLSGDAPQDVFKAANCELQNINQWLSSNKLTLNTEKTKFIIFTPLKSTPKYDNQIEINNKIIERVDKIKFLGTIINENLKWNDHINYITRKISKTTFVLKKCNSQLGVNDMLLLYNMLVKPHLEYGSETWGNTFKTVLERLFILQKRIIRLIYKLPNKTHTHAFFAKSKILKLHDIIYLNTCKHMHKAFQNALPENIQRNYVINPMHKNHFLTKYSRTCLRANDISITGIKIWNRLDQTIKSISNHRSFTRKLKQNIFHTY